MHRASPRAGARRDGCRPTRPRPRRRRRPSRRRRRRVNHRYRPHRRASRRASRLRAARARAPACGARCPRARRRRRTRWRAPGSGRTRAPTVRCRFAVTRPSCRPSVLRVGRRARSSSNASRVSCSSSLCTRYASSSASACSASIGCICATSPCPPMLRPSSSSGISRPRTVVTAYRMDARMIGPGPISVPSRSKRTMRKRTPRC